MTPTLLWFLITVLPGLGCALLTISVAAFICAGAAAMNNSMNDYGDDKKSGAKFPKRCLLIASITLLLAVPVPSQKDILIIIGGYAATNNAELKKLPDNILKAANTYLEKIVVEEKK